jgi:hypothetical protein
MKQSTEGVTSRRKADLVSKRMKVGKEIYGHGSLMGSETMNDFAGEGQHQFTGLDMVLLL